MEGPGSLSQDKRGQLRYEVRPDAASRQRLLEEHNRGPEPDSEIPPESEWFEITAHVAGSSEPWRGKLPGIDPRTGILPDGILLGRIDRLVRDHFPEKSAPDRDRVTFYLEGRILFPKQDQTITEMKRGEETVSTRLHWDHTRYQIGTERFTLVDCESYALLECDLDPGGIERHRDVRMLEALQFALGQTVLPAAIFRRSATGRRSTIRSFVRQDERGAYVQAPLLFSEAGDAKGVFRIAEAFYRRMLDWTVPDWHTVTHRGYQLIQAGGSPLWITALAYSVATEGVMGDCFPDAVQLPAEFIKEIDRLVAAVPTLNTTTAIAERVSGSLRAMKRASAPDRLHGFVTRCGFPDDVFMAWKRTRNSAAHGLDASASDAQDRVTDQVRILHLFYSIVLAYIRYEGPRTNYLASGYPEKPWVCPKDFGLKP